MSSITKPRNKERSLIYRPSIPAAAMTNCFRISFAAIFPTTCQSEITVKVLNEKFKKISSDATFSNFFSYIPRDLKTHQLSFIILDILTLEKLISLILFESSLFTLSCVTKLIFVALTV